jgi:hypothetical protein
MTLDGVLSETIWGESAFVAIPSGNCNYGTGCGATDTGASAQFKAAWNATGLWIGVVVNDPGTLYADNAVPWNGSGVEIFFDLTNAKAGMNGANYADANTYQFAITYNSATVAQYHNATNRTILAATQATPGSGYTMEIEIPWANLGATAPSAGSLSGLDVAVDVANAAGTARDHQIVAYNGNFNPYDQAPVQWGTLQYQACNSYTATNTPVFSPTPTFSPSPVILATPTFTPAPVGATLPYDEYEAEAAAYTGSLIGPSTTLWMNGGSLQTEIAAESSGREAVLLSAQGQSIQFTTRRQCNSIVVRYVIPDAPGGGGIRATLNCAVAGPGVNFNQELQLSSSYSWDYGGWGYPYNKNPGAGQPYHLYDETHALFGQEVPAGSTITLAKTAADTAAYYVIDLIDLEDVGAQITQPANSLNAITDYGATGNGSTDDTNALQNCINAAQNQGKTAYIPAGTYLISNPLSVPAVTVQGAGMWRTTIHQSNNVTSVVQFSLNNASATVSDLLLQGEVINRDDTATDSGFDYHGGTNSVVRNVWIEHTKCGWWVGNRGSVTNGLLVTGCRIRDTYADGVNFCNGTSNSTVTQTNLRNTGDDSLAAWSLGPGDNNNTFSYNTIQCTWRADGLAFYGGSNSNLLNNLVTDTLDQSGIMIQQGFGADGFGGTFNISNNTLIRAGGPFGGTNYGAIQLWANQGGLGGTFNFSNNVVQNSTFSGVVFQGGGANGGIFNGLTISNSGNNGIEVFGGTSGSATFSNTVVTGSNGLANNSGGAFTINRGAGNAGW